ncbi:hypothetical protein V8D89_012166 [Ganoderma adspersum]
MAKQLPTELWYRIIHFLPTTDQNACLSVSKMLHDIAVKYVFSHVIITLGLWRRDDELEDGMDSSPTPYDLLASRKIARANYALLRHIMQTPGFARHIKKLTVRAYSLFEGAPMEYEIGILVEAIAVLRNLTAFAWCGPLPKPPCEVMDALLRSSGQKITDILLHPEIPPDMCLPSFNQLKSLVFTHRFLDHLPAMHANNVPYHKTVHETITANAATLRRLDVFGDVLWACPPTSFSNLHELTIVFPRTLDGLTSVFEHCRALGSFTLCLHQDGPELRGVLAAHPDALPNLTSLKLLSAYELPEEAIKDVATFLKKKKRLRRLDVLTRTESPTGRANEPLLKIMPELPCLEVLGLDLRPARLTAAHVKLLQQHVPPQVTALFLFLQAESSSARAAHWRNFFSTHAALQYLHVATGTPDRAVADPLGDALFAVPAGAGTGAGAEAGERAEPLLPALELLGFDNGMRWVATAPRPAARPATAPRYAYEEFWPETKMYFRAVEDYHGCADWEWLLRHHGQDDDDCDMWLIDPPAVWKRMDTFKAE